MWTDEAGKSPIAEFWGWLLFVSVLVQGTLLLLEPCSIAYANGGADCLYFGVVFVLSLAVWMMEERKERGGTRKSGSDKICKIL